ncbi:MAG: NFACT family protein [Capsulimonadales bacterium]|nr:NFACT family protein [Capsulimonadales bacterium]
MTVSLLPFDAFTLAAVCADLRATTVGARVQKIQQPIPEDLILLVYGRSGAQRLLISTDPKSFRLHRTTQKRANPVQAPGFCQVCRKYLDGAFLLEVRQPRLDRVVELVFTVADGEKVRLIAELMGRNANLALVSGAGIVLGVQRPVPSDSSRPLRPGIRYEDPPGFRDRVDPFELTGPADAIFAEMPDDPEGAVRWIGETFSGIGKFATAEIAARIGSDPGGEPNTRTVLLDLIGEVRREGFEPHTLLTADGEPCGVWPFRPRSLPTERYYPRENISVALDGLYSEWREEAAENAEREHLRRTLEREIAFRRKELTAAQATLKEAARAEEYERIGNNLLAALASIEKGKASVVLPDLYGEPGETATVTLDPKRSPQENAEAYFVRARKARDAAEYATGQVADRTQEIARLVRLSERLARSDGDGSDGWDPLRSELAEIVGEARIATPGERRPAPTKKFEGYKIRTFTVDGFTLLVGETAEANDYLTTRVASPTDWWFHVRSAPGAHGVLRTEGKPDRVPESVLRKAAGIVAARSGTAIKHAGTVAVDMTEKRFVRKPRGAKPGLVTYERERTLDVTPDL